MRKDTRPWSGAIVGLIVRFCAMVIGTLAVTVHIPEAQSLKDKRMVVRSVRDKLRHNFDVSVKEVALHDLHQRARMAVTFVALDNAAADGVLEKIQTLVASNGDATMTGWTAEKLDFDETVALGVPHFS